MCGRYTLASPDVDALKRGLPFDEFSDTRIEFRARYNIAPGQAAPVVYLEKGGPVLADAVWGFTRKASGIVVNARSEGAATNKRFRDAFEKGRCLVPADGFYEWRREGSVNQPHLFECTEGGLLLMAGLWDDGRYVVLTRDPDTQVREIHDRMPVLLTREEAKSWLAGGELGAGVPLRRRPVSVRVNRIDHDDAACIEPVQQQAFEFD